MIITDIVTVAGVVLFMTLLMRAARSSKATVDPVTGARVARYSAIFRALGWFFVVGGIGLCVLAVKVAASLALGLAICVATMAAVLALLIEFTRIWVSWEDTTLVLHSPWRGVRTIRWADLAEVRFEQTAGWFVLRDRAGEVIRLSMWLGGLAEVLEELRGRAPIDLWPQIDHSVSTWKNRPR